MKTNKKPYIWSREHSPERLRLIQKAQKVWGNIFFEPEHVGHYIPIQYVPRELGWKNREFKAKINGVNLHVHLEVITAKCWFARTIYKQALELTKLRFPLYDQHHFEDGDRIGERRIVFHSEQHSLSGSYLWTSIWELSNEETSSFTESWFSEPCTKWGSSKSQMNINKSYNHTIDPQHIRFVVIHDVDSVTDQVLDTLERDIIQNGQPELSTHPIRFEFKDIKDDFTELSNPELVILNWQNARAKPTEVDQKLLKAAYSCDIEGITLALANGANPNIIDDNGDTPMNRLIDNWRNGHSPLDSFESIEEYKECYGNSKPSHEISLNQILGVLRQLINAGAHPDVFAGDGTPTLVNAVLIHSPQIVELLLQHGADASIDPFSEDFGSGPAAWFYANTDGFMLDQRGAREAYYMMIRYRHSPYNQVDEDQDRIDAYLPDAERSWHREYPDEQEG
ncbi:MULTISPECIES: ankyrin repeat domain-containing protein [Acinetobacter]|uniref:ankyrin repeat domain-containing protein n=1 Tax=Acinetobacter TaxID=469 RepID=UPI003EE249D6